MTICSKYIKLVKKCRQLGYKGQAKNITQMKEVYKSLTKNNSKFVPKKVFLKKVSKDLNKNLPKSEVWFNNKYENENIKIKFQANRPFIGYIPDLINKDLKIIIEIDGSIHENEEVKKKDSEKDIKYKQHGYTVIRIKAYNEESFQNAMVILNSLEPKQKIIKKSYNPIYVGTILKKDTICDICAKSLVYSYNSKSGGDYCNICFDLILIKSLE